MPTNFFKQLQDSGINPAKLERDIYAGKAGGPMLEDEYWKFVEGYLTHDFEVASAVDADDVVVETCVA